MDDAINTAIQYRIFVDGANGLDYTESRFQVTLRNDPIITGVANRVINLPANEEESIYITVS